VAVRGDCSRTLLGVFGILTNGMPDFLKTGFYGQVKE
jgi:hypothetical protein